MIDFLPPNPERKPRKPTTYRKSEAVRMLERMADADYVAKHPTMPPYPHKFSDQTANDLTKAIVKYIELKGGFASRISVQGTYSAKLGKYIPGTAKRGLADIMGTYKNKSISIEVKIGKDRQSDYQIKVEQQITKAGGLYFIARDFQSVVEWLEMI
jgi:hypothetical protein